MKINSTNIRLQLKRAGLALGCLWAVGASSVVQANNVNWPNKPIKFIVCFPPGNAADTLARSVGPLLSAKLGQPVVVENRGGAGGMIGMEALVRSAPDDHSFGVCSLSPVTILPAVRSKMPYDIERDIAPVLLSNKGPMVLLVNKKSPFNSLEELLKYSKENPGKLTYGTLGPGTISQMSTDAFKLASGVKAVDVSYKGSAQVLTDLIAGHLDFALDGAASASTQLAAGTVKALAVTTQKRAALLPDVPTMNELNIEGLKNFDYYGWVAFFAPSKTSPVVIEAMNKELTEILKMPQMQQRALASGQEIVEPNSAQQFKVFMKKDFERWSEIAKKLNVKISD